MDKNSNNIDNLFKNLKTFKSQPPASGWNNISEKVFFNNIISDLQQFTIKTKDYLWHNIAKNYFGIIFYIFPILLLIFFILA